MRRALALANRGYTSPNPMVGAVVVKDGKIIGEGFHKRAGEPHAEAIALNNAASNAKDADLYVTLEPCCHYGRMPPCVDAVISSGVRRVFAAMVDPNPKVSGKGLAILRDAGIETHTGLLEDKARRLNEAFIKFITTGLPFVTLKMAMTLDGKIATRNGDSKWISGEASRQYVHRLRARADAVAVGIGTMIKDDPELTARDVKSPAQPRRLIIDPMAKTPTNARVLYSKGGEVIIAVNSDAPTDRVRALVREGARILTVGNGSHIDFSAMVGLLGKEGFTNILLEGGGEVAASALESGSVDKVLFFVAPKIIGGREAKTPVEGTGAALMSEALCLNNMSAKHMGTDYLIEAYLKKH